MQTSRRQFLSFSAALSLATAIPWAHAADDPEMPVTGMNIPTLASFDRWAQAFMQEHNIPGGQFAAARGGEVIYARGFGYADRDAKTPVETDSLFRIASV